MKTLVLRIIGATLLLTAGCAYKGGKVVDGTNLEIGISVPGTDGYLTFNALAYTGGLKVCGDERTVIVVTNVVAETNSYFGLVKTQRYSNMAAAITPVYWTLPSTNGLPTLVIFDKPSKKK